MKKNVLIIDDEGLITKTLQKLLTKQDYNAVVASSGKEAIDKIKEADFDLIVSDIRMPEMDGIETIEKMRELQKTLGKKPAPEIIITGFADEQKYKSAVDLRVAAYIYKPFDTKELLDTIQRTLDATKK